MIFFLYRPLNRNKDSCLLKTGNIVITYGLINTTVLVAILNTRNLSSKGLMKNMIFNFVRLSSSKYLWILVYLSDFSIINFLDNLHIKDFSLLYQTKSFGKLPKTFSGFLVVYVTIQWACSNAIETGSESYVHLSPRGKENKRI